MHSRGDPGWRLYAGLFMVALATLMLEILLTRIFSVTMWYHFAFVSISIALFGLSVGAIIVYLLPGSFSHERVKEMLSLFSLLFAISIVLSFLTQLCIPFALHASLIGLYSIVLLYSVIAVPFIFSGICIALALTKFPRHISKLYCADLVGAAMGCMLLIPLLGTIDGPTAVIAVAGLAALGAVFFGLEGKGRRALRWSVTVLVLAAIFVVGHTILVRRNIPLIRLMWVRGSVEGRGLYERWNTFSRIKVAGDPDLLQKPFGWGMSATYPSDKKVRQLILLIDSYAGTVLLHFNGDMDAVDHLRYDVSNIAHYLRPDSKVLVVGTGGGRDILSALAFDQREVVGVEINRNIIDAVNEEFGDFTGHLDKDRRVKFVNDEARSYIARSAELYDIIQISQIDTFAATSSGAFVLAENNLYTVEAWRIFLEHLTPDGVLSFSRWYVEEQPNQVYRLVSLAEAALSEMEVKDPSEHIVVVRNIPPEEEMCSLGTVLVRRSPFPDKEIDILEDICRKMEFIPVLTPRGTVDEIFSRIASGKDLEGFYSNFSWDITPPTDDRPFFFHILRLKDIFKTDLIKGANVGNLKAVVTLGFLLATVIILTVLCIVVPLAISTDRAALRGTVPFFIYFSAIGFGYMIIEISQLQRLIIVLGHPVYSLSVVLSSLLVASGLGSLATEKLIRNGRKGVLLALALLMLTIAAFGTVTPFIMHRFESSSTASRILVSIAILFPLGFFMGMPFPIGIKLASAREGSPLAWFWGINGAASVCASVLAFVLALTWGISFSFWVGAACYIITLLTIPWLTRRTG